MIGHDHAACDTSSRRPSTPTASGDTRAGFREAGRGARTRSAQGLRIPEAADPVARCHLPRDTAAGILEGPVGVRQPIQIRGIQPAVRIAGIQVVIDVRTLRCAASDVRVGEVPDAVLQDRTADRPPHIVGLGERSTRRRPLRSQRRREIVGLQVLPGAADEERPLHRIAAVPGHDVHHESRGLRLAQGTRGRERHLRRVAGIDHIASRRIAVGRTADSQSVEREAPFVRPAAVHRERGGRSTCDGVVDVRDDARYEHEQRVVTANRRNRLDDLACRATPRASRCARPRLGPYP